MDLLEKLKILLELEDESKNPLLAVLIEEAKDDVVNYCNLDEYSSKLDNIVIKMVRFKFEKLGAESLKSQSFSGISESINEDYTPDIYKSLNRYKRAGYPK